MKMLTVSQISKQYPVTRSTIYRMLKQGRINRYGEMFCPDEIMSILRKKTIIDFDLNAVNEWRDIEGWPNYKVSDNGIIYQKVRTLRRMPGVLKPQLSGQSGYHQIQLVDGYKRKFFYVHQLVAKAFIPNPECKPKVNHLDGNKANNHYSNLEWCTQSENMYHALENGLHPHSDKYVNKRSIAIQMIKEGYRPKEIIQATGYHAVSISRLKNQITPIETSDEKLVSMNPQRSAPRKQITLVALNQLHFQPKN